MKQSLWQIRVLIAANLLLLSTTPLLAQDNPPLKGDTYRAILDHNFPRMVLVLTIDQLRADLLSRYSHQFVPAFGADGEVGGFRWLMEKGAVMADAHYNHVPTHTGPGHATILTGASPRKSGIVGNAWHTSTGLTINCVGDPDEVTIGVPGSAVRRGSSSPKNLLAETVGDALKLANNRQSKVVGIAIKDRGAILPSGHNADAAVWFDTRYGKWVTSTWYHPTALPEFAQRANDANLADRWLGAEWDYLLPQEAYKISMPEGAEGVGSARGLPSTFPKNLSEPGAIADNDYYSKLTASPFGNEMVFETAKLAIEYGQLGQDLYPDILAVSLSTPDSVGHYWGPHSRESQDTMLRADRQLSNFLNFLGSTVPGGLDNVTIILTGDHGAVPLPEWTHTMKASSRRVLYKEIVAAAEKALGTEYKDKKTTGTVMFYDPYIRFRMPVLESQKIDIGIATKIIADKLREVDGISAVYTREQIEHGNLPNTQEAQYVTNGFNPERSGEMVLINDQYFYNSTVDTGTAHGSAFNYDTQVPVIFVGNHIQPGVYTDRTDVRDIAPTLSFLLGISAPASSEGRILSDIIK